VFARVVPNILTALRGYCRQPPVCERMLKFLGADEERHGRPAPHLDFRKHQSEGAMPPALLISSLFQVTTVVAVGAAVAA
jgi:hypothetical protein